ncbi:MAG: VWA domain-containing protein [Trueperaceae bacterium]|nr:VWA domain-containing protein [Trueperaceae bacterium]
MAFVAATFAFPWALLLLGALPLLPRGRSRPWRLVVLGLLVVALAQPQLPRPSEDLVVALDVSESVGDAAQRASGKLATASWGAAPRFMAFGGDAAFVPDPRSEPPAFLDRSKTDMARALQVAAAEAPSRILLVSDGVASRGDALAAAPGLPVDVHYVPPRPNARLTALLVPDGAAPFETLEAVAVVELDRAAEVVLRPSVDGTSSATLTRDLPAGRHAIAFRVVAGEAGTLRVEATMEVDYDQPTADDRQATEVSVTEEVPVLVIGDPAMANALRAQGLDVVEGGPEAITGPLEASAVVLRSGVGAFSSGQLELLARYVESGGGLMMTGGPESFGLGGWYRTPVETVLPVSSDVRTDVMLPQVAMVIVLDKSMSMVAGNPSRIDLAKQGTIDVIDLAYEQDLLGLIVFSDPSLTEWVFGLRQATERGKREMYGATLDIQPQGGTILLPGYRMAVEALDGVDASIKHIVVLSDGILYDGAGPFSSGPTPNWFALAAEARALGITTSAIAIGDGADSDQLGQIARGGGGRFYEALDVTTLPRIFTNEALATTRDLLRDEVTAPTARRHPLSSLSGTTPSVDAYVATTLKREAEAILVGRDDEPILAVGRQGLGRTAALTTDLNAWGGDFAAWSEFPGLIGTVVRWLQARPAQYSVTTQRAGNDLEVVVDAVVDGAYVNNLALTTRFQGRSVAMRQVAPGRYAATLEVDGSGGTLIVADGQEVVARRSVATPDPEFAPLDGAAALAALAERTGGEVVADLATYRPPAAARATPMWAWPAALALVLFLAELVWRRLGRDRSDPLPRRPRATLTPRRARLRLSARRTPPS